MKNHMIGAVSLPMICSPNTHQTLCSPGKSAQVRWSMVIAVIAISLS